MKFGTIVAWVCGAVFATGTLLIGSSYLVGHEFEIERDEATVLMQSMREQMFADMMHDTMRGVAYKALYAAATGDSAIAAEASAEIVEYGDAFAGAIAAQQELDLPADIRAALDAVAGPLTDYMASAKAIVGKAATEGADAAKADLPAFETTFGTLEGAMEGVSDTISGANDRNNAASQVTVTLSRAANIGGMAVILALTGAMLLFSRRFIVTPITAMTSSMRGLADGKLDVAVPDRHPVAEMAAMASTLGVFRSALQSRAELAANADAAAQKTAERASQSAELNRSLAEVVGAAANGDFSAASIPALTIANCVTLPAPSTTWSPRSIPVSAKAARCLAPLPGPSSISACVASIKAPSVGSRTIPMQWPIAWPTLSGNCGPPRRPSRPPPGRFSPAPTT